MKIQKIKLRAIKLGNQNFYLEQLTSTEIEFFTKLLRIALQKQEEIK